MRRTSYLLLRDTVFITRTLDTLQNTRPRSLHIASVIPRLASHSHWTYEPKMPALSGRGRLITTEPSVAECGRLYTTVYCRRLLQTLQTVAT